jgi:hypothetical protein
MSEGRAATRQTRETGCGDVPCFFSIPFFLGVEIVIGPLEGKQEPIISLFSLPLLSLRFGGITPPEKTADGYELRS